MFIKSGDTLHWTQVYKKDERLYFAVVFFGQPSVQITHQKHRQYPFFKRRRLGGNGSGGGHYRAIGEGERRANPPASSLKHFWQLVDPEKK